MNPLVFFHVFSEILIHLHSNSSFILSLHNNVHFRSEPLYRSSQVQLKTLQQKAVEIVKGVRWPVVELSANIRKQRRVKKECYKSITNRKGTHKNNSTVYCCAQAYSMFPILCAWFVLFVVYLHTPFTAFTTLLCAYQVHSFCLSVSQYA